MRELWSYNESKVENDVMKMKFFCYLKVQTGFSDVVKNGTIFGRIEW